MLVETFLKALRTYQETEQLLKDENLDEVEKELTVRHLAHAKVELQEALDDYVDMRVRQRLLEHEMTGT